MGTQTKFATARVNDYMYDPNFIVPTEKDHMKHAFTAAMASAQVGVAPVFSNMFSDLTNCPRQTIVMKVGPRTPFYKPALQGGGTVFSPQNVDIAGADRATFFKMPTITISPEMINQVMFSPVKYHAKKSPKPLQKQAKSRGIQTDYRDSSAQTTHWKTPDYVIMDDSDPEILKLNFLNENLPPGVHEVEMIKRARRRRAWELLLPDVEDAASLEQRRLILEAIELDQWAFREEEIQAIQELRLELLERMLQELLDTTAARTNGKLERISTRLHHEHQAKVHKMKHKKERELRRLYRQTFGVSTKYGRVNIIDEHADYKSETYAPLMRFGENPKRGHAHIRLEHYEPAQHEVELMSTLPRWVFDSKLLAREDIPLPGRRLCIRETKWTEPVLQQLHDELASLHVAARAECRLRTRRRKPQALDDTLRLLQEPDEEAIEQENQAALILQCIIRGRAAQTLIYEGRDRCRELIEELQSTHFLDSSQNAEMRRRRMEVLNQQRNKQVLLEREANLEAALNQLQGHVLGTMLDFLSKELVRIRDERKAHALALLYERERRDREAAEAGRRQVEERRRKEHDEMFKQIVKVHQDTVDLYLQDIVTEGIDHASDVDATEYVKKLAAQVEQKAQQPPSIFVEKEELIANMVCNYLIPDVEKTRIRQATKKRQQKHLRCAHEAIYNKIEKLPKIKDDDSIGCIAGTSEDTSTTTDERIRNYLENMVGEESPLRLSLTENIARDSTEVSTESQSETDASTL